MHRVLRLAAPAAPAVVAALFALTLGAPANASNILSHPKAYAVHIAPATVNGGTTASVTATFTNEGNVQIQTAELIWPAPLRVQSATLPAGMTQPSVSTCAQGGGTVPCVQVTNLNLAPGATSAPVTMSVSSAPACSNVTGPWSVVARNDAATAFLSTAFDNNPLPLDTANSALTTTVDDSCYLKFAAPGPQSIVVGQPITTTAYNSPTPGGPFTIDVYDVNQNQLVTDSGASVSVALGNNFGGASLSGTATVNAVHGVASFQGLSLNEPGNDYTLTASSSGMKGDTSSGFDAQSQGTPCSAGTCTLTSGTTQGSGQVTATGASGTQVDLVGSVNANGDGPLTCGSYVSMDPNTYEFLTTATDVSFSKVMTITINDPIGAPPFDASDTNGFTIPGGDRDNDYDDVLWNSQICLQAPYAFMQRGGGTPTPTLLPDGTKVWTGLLPDCTTPASGGPCHDRAHDAVIRDPSSPVGYDIKLVADIPAGLPGDPRMN
jgi:hypothetical protein